MVRRIRLTIVRGGALVLLMLAAAPARAQGVDHHDMNMNDDQWMLAQDGIVSAEFNRQGAPAADPNSSPRTGGWASRAAGPEEDD